MQAEQIKQGLTAIGANQTSFARHLGVSAAVVCNVINGRVRAAKIEQALSKAIGFNPFPAPTPRGRKKNEWAGK